ncbi:MAG TPA: hypothetical protein VFE50_13785 [Cyclobacteriaceae bacterium]|nr:hypothetical protein [Cyclobacteriaceae bacterium]
MQMTVSRNLTADEVFFIFKEEHRLCSPLDTEADMSFDLKQTSTIDEWRDARNLLKWKELAKVYNTEFGIQISEEEWEQAFEPGEQRTIMDVCNLISSQAQVQIIRPIKWLGATCLSASLFKSITKHLESRGIDISKLFPSSEIEPILKKNFGEFFMHINKNFTGVIPEIKVHRAPHVKLTTYLGLLSITSLLGSIFWDGLTIVSVVAFLAAIVSEYFYSRQFDKQDGMLTIPGIVTFRDLVQRIIDVKYTSYKKL